MNNPQHEHLHVAIIGSRPAASASLRNVLRDNGFLVDHDLHLDDVTLKHIYDINVDAVLVDLDDSADQKLELLEAILEHSPAPVLFNDAAYDEPGHNPASDRRLRTLMNKLRKIGHRPVSAPAVAAATAVLQPVQAVQPAVTADAPAVSEPARQEAELLAQTVSPAAVSQPATAPPPAARTTRDLPLWILGASLGGPAALREFFAHIPESLPVCFLVVQHIGPSHVDLFASQLQRASALGIELLDEQSRLDKGKVFVSPVESSTQFRADGSLKLAAPSPGCIYSPCIDTVIENAVATLGDQVNVIIFSGMGNDGEVGCQLTARRGGRVWAQDSASCVINSMPERARSTGTVSFSGSPARLARELVNLYT